MMDKEQEEIDRVLFCKDKKKYIPGLPYQIEEIFEPWPDGYIPSAYRMEET